MNECITLANASDVFLGETRWWKQSQIYELTAPEWNIVRDARDKTSALNSVLVSVGVPMVPADATLFQMTLRSPGVILVKVCHPSFPRTNEGESYPVMRKVG